MRTACGPTHSTVTAECCRPGATSYEIVSFAVGTCGRTASVRINGDEFEVCGAAPGSGTSIIGVGMGFWLTGNDCRLGSASPGTGSNGFVSLSGVGATSLG